MSPLDRFVRFLKLFFGIKCTPVEQEKIPAHLPSTHTAVSSSTRSGRVPRREVAPIAPAGIPALMVHDSEASRARRNASPIHTSTRRHTNIDRTYADDGVFIVDDGPDLLDVVTDVIIAEEIIGAVDSPGYDPNFNQTQYDPNPCQPGYASDSNAGCVQTPDPAVYQAPAVQAPYDPGPTYTPTPAPSYDPTPAPSYSPSPSYDSGSNSSSSYDSSSGSGGGDY